MIINGDRDHWVSGTRR